MEEQLNQKESKQKLTYEQLNDACNQLWMQNKQLAKRNGELEEFCMYKRLDYLFKVVESSLLFPKQFVDTCTKEIMEAMTVTQEGKADK